MALTAFLACDLDGTLLDADGRWGEGAVEFLRDVTTRTDVRVVAATGRRFASAQPLLLAAGLDGLCAVQNGAMVCDVVTGELQHAAFVAPRQVQALTVALERERQDVLVYRHAASGPGELSVPERPRDPTGFLARYLPYASGHFAFRSAGSLPPDEQVTRVVTHGSEERLVDLQRAMAGVAGPTVRSFLGFDGGHGVHRLEFLHVEADKSRAVRWIAARDGVEMERVVAAGDDANDVELLRDAGVSFAAPAAHAAAVAAAGTVLVGPPVRAVVDALRAHFNLPLEDGAGRRP